MNYTQRILSSFSRLKISDRSSGTSQLKYNNLYSSLSRLHFSNTSISALASATTTSSYNRTTNSNNGNKQEVVKFLFLNNISDNPGAIKKKRRVGRGIGSSKGKTCGRGHKGQKARSGSGIKPFFEGGQTPLYKRLPKRGFNNTKFAQPMTPINVGKIQDFIDMGRLILKKNEPITIKDVVESGMLKANSIPFGIKLLGDGKDRVHSPINIEISRASSSAIEAIEAAGGCVTTVHYNKLALRALLKPHTFQIIPRRASPPPKLMPYYTSYENRGYLSAEVQRMKLLAKIDEESEEKKDL